MIKILLTLKLQLSIRGEDKNVQITALQDICFFFVIPYSAEWNATCMYLYARYILLSSDTRFGF